MPISQLPLFQYSTPSALWNLKPDTPGRARPTDVELESGKHVRKWGLLMRVFPVVALLVTGPLPFGSTMAEEQGVRPPANAPPATASADQLQEVVVTAQSRKESAQQAPIAITAINAEGRVVIPIEESL